MVGARWRIGSVGIVRAQCPWRRDVGCSIFLYPSGFPPFAVSGRVRLYHGVASGPLFRSPCRDSRGQKTRPSSRRDRIDNALFSSRESGGEGRESDGERWIFEFTAGRGEIWTVM